MIRVRGLDLAGNEILDCLVHFRHQLLSSALT